MNYVWDGEISPASKRLAMLALADQANDQGVTWPSVATIARRIGCSRSTAESALKALEADGLIKRDRRFNDSTVYTINIAALKASTTPPENRGTPEKQAPPPPKTGGTPPENPGPNHQRTLKKNPPPAAPASEPALFPEPDKELTEAQVIDRLAKAHYERMGNAGHVVAWKGIIKSLLRQGFEPAQIERALTHHAKMNWGVTIDGLVRTLRANHTRQRPTRLVGGQRLEGF
jgi:DNA-binding transcriptional MocR family regulator